MPLHLTKWERREGADRDAFARAALNLCRVARAQEGVRDARFYWANHDTVGIAINAENGAWGPNTGRPPVPEVAKTGFALSDLARMVTAESWGDAGMGEHAYQMSR